MNWLAHLLLSGDDPAVRLGNVLADVLAARGAVPPPALGRGVACHRAIDGFTDRHPVVASSRSRFAPPARRYAGILVDVYFDHLLAAGWAEHCEVELGRFTGDFYAAGRRDAERLLPPGGPARAVLARMAAEDWLGCNRTAAGVRLTLGRIARRMSPRVLAGFDVDGAMDQLRARHRELWADFQRFFPELTAASAAWR